MDEAPHRGWMQKLSYVIVGEIFLVLAGCYSLS
jgi:hypothetical protein